MSLALDQQFEFRTPKILLTEDKSHIPSLLEGYEVIVARNDKQRKRQLGQFLPDLTTQLREITIKPKVLPFEVTIVDVDYVEKANRQNRDRELIDEISLLVRSGLVVDELLNRIVSRIAEILGCTHCTLFLQQQENGTSLLEPQVSAGLHTETIMKRRFRPDEGLAGWVFQHGLPLCVGDATLDARFSPARAQRNHPRSMLVAPIQAGSKTIGLHQIQVLEKYRPLFGS